MRRSTASASGSARRSSPTWRWRPTAWPWSRGPSPRPASRRCWPAPRWWSAGATGASRRERSRCAGGAPAASDGALAKVWARAHVRDLEDRYATGTAHDADLERRIVRTSLDFGVLSRFTAFVALDTVVVNRDGRLHRVTQPVEVPQGWAWPAAEPEAVPIPFVEGRGGFLSVDSAVARHAMPPPASRPHLRPAVELPKLPVPPVPPVPPVATTGQGRRFWRSLPAQVGGEEGAASTAGLDAYRRRAGELARELEALPEPALGGPDRAGRGPAPALAAMAAKVAALVADLESVGADPRVIEPLRELVADLVRPGERPRGLRDRAVATLREFAEKGP